MRGSAAVVTVGSELTQGLRIDTNTAEIARELSLRGFDVAETISIGDDSELLAVAISRLVEKHALVVTTGGLGPTHDDITREAAARALRVALSSDGDIIERLADVQSRHTDPAAREAVLTQALVLGGAEIIHATTGTAPGQIVPTAGGSLVLLPGPPAEMRPMLLRSLERFARITAPPVELGVTGVSESDVQHAAQRALEPFEGIILTVLAKPGDVRVLLIDDGAGAESLHEAACAVAVEVGESCYTTEGLTLPAALLQTCHAHGLTVATAESCTGGLVSAAITDVPGASDVFLGGVVSYGNQMKMDALEVPAGLLAQYGAVSEETARAMAEGVRALSGADLAVSVTGIAGPDGGSADKPVGLVWFAVAGESGTSATRRLYARGARESIRARAASTALDLLRRAALDR